MSRDARQQQRKEKRNKREKEKRKKLNQSKSISPFATLAKVEQAPFTYCCINKSVFSGGMGNLLVSRAVGSRVVFVVFLVDMYCLGIKNVVYKMCSRIELERIARERIFGGEPAQNLSPEEAKKLVVEAAAYAARYGLRPHEDYPKCLAIFDGVDASTCTREFTFGKDGKPLYINGPHDSSQFQQRVRETLERTAGPGNYDYIAMLDERTFTIPRQGETNDSFDEIDDEEFDDEDDEDVSQKLTDGSNDR